MAAHGAVVHLGVRMAGRKRRSRTTPAARKKGHDCTNPAVIAEAKQKRRRRQARNAFDEASAARKKGHEPQLSRVIASGSAREVTLVLPPRAPQPDAEQMAARARLRRLERDVCERFFAPLSECETRDPIEQVQNADGKDLRRLSADWFRAPEDWPSLEELRALYVERCRLLNIIHRDAPDRWCEECCAPFAELKSGTGNLCPSCTSTSRLLRRKKLGERRARLELEVKACRKCSKTRSKVRFCSSHQRRWEQYVAAIERAPADAMQNYDASAGALPNELDRLAREQFEDDDRT